jgi:hypothetical protein
MIPHVSASNGDLAFKKSVHLLRQRSLARRGSLNIRGSGWRHTSSEVAKDGILAGESTNVPGLVQIYLVGLKLIY